MLRLLFQIIEQSLGPSLSEVASLIYWISLLLLVCTVLVPVYRVRMDYATARTGMEQRWVMTCGHCGKLTMVTGRTCGQCGRDLGIPWMVRLWTASSRRQGGKWTQRIKWVGHLLGSAGFLILSIWLVTVIGALAPQGELHRLFLGFALLAWAAVGWLAGRALRLGPRGMLGRVRDALLALAAIGVMALALFLADAARPIREIPLARFSTDGGMVRIGERRVLLPQGEIEFEYLQLDHDRFGYHRIIPVAFLGAERVPFPRSALGQWVANHLREHAETCTARGLTVRLRSDRLRVTPGQSYEVIQQEGQVLIRRAGDTEEPQGYQGSGRCIEQHLQQGGGIHDDHRLSRSALMAFAGGTLAITGGRWARRFLSAATVGRSAMRLTSSMR